MVQSWSTMVAETARNRAEVREDPLGEQRFALGPDGHHMPELQEAERGEDHGLPVAVAAHGWTRPGAPAPRLP